MQTTITTEAPYTILRIKRRRDEEPLDALVVEGKSRRKRTKGAPGLFQYAQTVEDTAWGNEQVQKEIQERIARLAREKTDLKAVSPIHERTSPFSTRQDTVHARKYTIIEASTPPSPNKKQAFGPIPPASTTPAAPPQDDFKMYDAVLSTENEEPNVDPEMEKFNMMLKDYLTVNQVDLKPSSSSYGVDSVMKSPDGDGDYVWDVFYHRPATLAEWNEIANIGTLTGFPARDEDSYSSDSESEIEDEADEDSNEEDYYRNDYPDEEDDSDEWHESSEYEDDIHDRGTRNEYQEYEY